eukprot:GHVT01006198.1.p1 GENE.GHVT01006198.1~~GHVT01006198.1.p1  ORF type:complete len:131 (-),score=5.70 GHVT01006198.1:90-482(-)
MRFDTYLAIRNTFGELLEWPAFQSAARNTTPQTSSGREMVYKLCKCLLNGRAVRVECLWEDAEIRRPVITQVEATCLALPGDAACNGHVLGKACRWHPCQSCNSGRFCQSCNSGRWALRVECRVFVSFVR